MNFKDFTNKLAGQFPEIKKTDLAEISRTVIKLAEDSAISDGKCIVGKSMFKLVTKPARACRNPKTGEQIMVPERKFVIFKKKI